MKKLKTVGVVQERRRRRRKREKEEGKGRKEAILGSLAFFELCSAAAAHEVLRNVHILPRTIAAAANTIYRRCRVVFFTLKQNRVFR